MEEGKFRALLLIRYGLLMGQRPKTCLYIDRVYLGFMT